MCSSEISNDGYLGGNILRWVLALVRVVNEASWTNEFQTISSCKILVIAIRRGASARLRCLRWPTGYGRCLKMRRDDVEETVVLLFYYDTVSRLQMSAKKAGRWNSVRKLRKNIHAARRVRWQNSHDKNWQPSVPDDKRQDSHFISLKRDNVIDKFLFNWKTHLGIEDFKRHPSRCDAGTTMVSNTVAFFVQSMQTNNTNNLPRVSLY